MSDTKALVSNAVDKVCKAMKCSKYPTQLEAMKNLWTVLKAMPCMHPSSETECPWSRVNGSKFRICPLVMETISPLVVPSKDSNLMLDALRDHRHPRLQSEALQVMIYVTDHPNILRTLVEQTNHPLVDQLLGMMSSTRDIEALMKTLIVVDNILQGSRQFFAHFIHSEHMRTLIELTNREDVQKDIRCGQLILLLLRAIFESDFLLSRSDDNTTETQQKKKKRRRRNNKSTTDEELEVQLELPWSVGSQCMAAMFRILTKPRQHKSLIIMVCEDMQLLCVRSKAYAEMVVRGGMFAVVVALLDRHTDQKVLTSALPLLDQILRHYQHPPTVLLDSVFEAIIRNEAKLLSINDGIFSLHWLIEKNIVKDETVKERYTQALIPLFQKVFEKLQKI